MRSESERTGQWLESFLADPDTKQLLGKKFDVFATKWRNCFSYLETPEDLRWYTQPFSSRGLLGNFSWQNVKSLIWPALLGPYWFAYRKLYLATFIALAALLAVQSAVPTRYLIGITVAIAVTCLLYGPAILLTRSRKTVLEAKRIADPDARNALIKRRGGRSILAVALMVAAYMAVGVSVELLREQLTHPLTRASSRLSALAQTQILKPKLKVEKFQHFLGTYIKITNVGDDVMTVRTVTVNGRAECVKPAVFPVITEPLPQTIKVGEAVVSFSECPLVRVLVETDRGSETYTFN
jgi:hypothetical protein